MRTQKYEFVKVTWFGRSNKYHSWAQFANHEFLELAGQWKGHFTKIDIHVKKVAKAMGYTKIKTEFQ